MKIVVINFFATLAMLLSINSTAQAAATVLPEAKGFIAAHGNNNSVLSVSIVVSGPGMTPQMFLEGAGIVVTQIAPHTFRGSLTVNQINSLVQQGIVSVIAGPHDLFIMN